MVEWGINQTLYPVTIRVPSMECVVSGREDSTDYSILNKYQVTKQGKMVAVIALGNFYQLGEKVVEDVAEEIGVEATLINPKYITGLDENLLERLKEDHDLVITLEDGIKKSFPDRYVPEKLLKENGISVEQITEDIKTLIGVNESKFVNC